MAILTLEVLKLDQNFNNFYYNSILISNLIEDIKTKIIYGYYGKYSPVMLTSGIASHIITNWSIENDILSCTIQTLQTPMGLILAKDIEDEIQLKVYVQSQGREHYDDINSVHIIDSFYILSIDLIKVE